MDRLRIIRQAEAKSHIEAYNNFPLYETGSWLSKPVQTVMELLPLLEKNQSFRALDLGCGVGRNSIPVAQHFCHTSCRVDCVDILAMAIEKLNENAREYGVSNAIQGIVASIDSYEIEPESYDFIMAISALEHVDSETGFVRKLEQIRNGLRAGGIACLIVNTDVREWDKTTGRERAAQFEVNLKTEKMQGIMKRIFSNWQTVKHTVAHQKYDVPREDGMVTLETDVVTYVIRKTES